jgi:hypothetical protein
MPQGETKIACPKQARLLLREANPSPGQLLTLTMTDVVKAKPPFVNKHFRLEVAV